MATETYIVNRKTYHRPQALCFADNPGVISGTALAPEGREFSNFIVLSDHNRSEINIEPTRIGTKKRAINGAMRSYWVADKLSISTSWKDLPSRGWINSVYVDENTGMLINSETMNPAAYSDKFTADGGAGGNELLEWYRNFQGSFWVYLAYDRYPIVGGLDQMNRYNEVVEMMFADFSYSVIKRGRNNIDLWDIDIKLEEV